MISSFGKFAKGLGAKLILTALGLSMIVFWGLGGLTNISLSRNKPAAEVGRENISMKQVSDAFDRERMRLSALTGGTYISPAQGIQNGLLTAAVQGQVINAVQRQVRDELGLTASDAAVRKYVERNPAFADALGHFDKNIFYAYLSQNKLSETELARKLRDELAMNHLTGTIADLGYNPTILADAVYKYQNEKRSVTAALIEPDKINITKTPTDEELQEYLDAYAEQFISPEYRTVSLVHITPAAIADKIVVDEAQINEIYAEKKDTFGTPEKRLLDHMLFDSEDKARAAMVGLNADTFRKVAQSAAGQNDSQTDFGWVGKEDIIAELGDVVFAGAKASVIGPVESPLGWHVVLIRDIRAGSTPSEHSIKADIKKQLAADNAYQTMEDVVRQLEDKLGAGETLDDAAKALNLAVQSIGTFDITGTKKDGTSLADTFKSATLLQDIFSLENGEVSSVIEHQNGYIVARVDNIIAAAPQDFMAAKPALIRLWKQQQQQKALPDKAADLLTRVRGGQDPQTSGVFQNFHRFKESNITRTKPGQLPAEAVEAVFAQGQGAAQATALPVNGGMLITLVNAIQPADADKDSFGLNVVKQNLKSQTGEGLANEVMGYFADDLGVKINEKEIIEAFSVYQKEE
ncbi:MAG: peptidyl-prolyl cis-trans isomerase [Alphaproteobacteria bacterium]